MNAAPATLAQKLIARAAGRAQVTPGEIVTCDVDLAMFHDSSGPRRLKPMLEELGAQIWDKRKVVLVIDHYVPGPTTSRARSCAWRATGRRRSSCRTSTTARASATWWCRQHGHIRPGMLCVGGDSHSPTGGAFGAYMFGIGATEMLGVMVTGRIWLQVPHTLFMRWIGRLTEGVSAKDMMLAMLGRFGMNGGQYQAVEYCGEAVSALSMQERMTLANMSAEFGAQVGLVPPDQTTRRYLAEHRRRHRRTRPRALAQRRRRARHLALLRRLVAVAAGGGAAQPGQRAAGGRPRQHAHRHRLHRRLHRRQARRPARRRARAGRLQGGHRRDAAGGAGEREADRDAAEREGILGHLVAAGATMLPTACGACAGYGSSIPEGSTVISSTARNFKGRMGANTAQVYLGSPYTVAASALRGRIADAREFLA
jgi:3-isopropylmalate/(R)-2-methylmalate dehydratase large subunit